MRERIQIRPLLLALELVVLLQLVGCRWQWGQDYKKWTKEISELEAAHAVATARIQQLDPSSMTSEERIEVWPIAQWLGCLDRTYGSLSTADKALACWTIFCRMESNSFPDTALEVLQEPGQFAEFSVKYGPTNSDLEIVLDQYRNWVSGINGKRLCGPNAVYMVVDEYGVSIRDNYDPAKASVWRAG